MGRHSKNSNTLPYYARHERKLDGYGTQTKRLAKESIREFDCCWLTLQPCKDPMITPQGYLYDKEAIFENLLHQKAEIAKKQQAYAEQLQKAEKEKQAEKEEAKQADVERFMKNESSVSGANLLARSSASAEKSQANLKHNFWIPENTPDSKPVVLEKPDTNTRCPFSGEKLRVKDLVAVKFTLLDPKNAEDSKGRYKYMCPVTFKTLTNSVPCAVLKKSGRVVSMAAVNEIIKKDMIDPVDGTAISEGDIIEFQRGGTGYAGGGVSLEAKVYQAAAN